MLPSGTVTFLFTDIQGSTQLWDSFPTEMRAAFGVHDSIVTEAVGASDGQVVKNTGDGIFAAFAIAQDAITASIAIQRGLAAQEWDPAIESLAVRVALHTDTAEPEDGDYHGSAINLCAIASRSVSARERHVCVRLHHLSPGHPTKETPP